MIKAAFFLPRVRSLATAVVLALLSLQSAAFAQTDVLPPSPATIHLADLGFSDTTLTGRLFRSDYFFPGPGEYRLAPKGSSLDLDYIPSVAAAADSDSVLTVFWNDVPVKQIPLSGSSQRESTVIPLPSDRINQGFNKLTLDGVVVEPGPCREDDSQDHFTLLKDTTIHYALLDDKPHPVPVVPNLATYPAPFFETDPLAPSDVTFVLPANPGPEVLEAVAEISAGLGRAAGASPLTLHEISDSGSLPPDAAQANFIYVGLPADLPGLRELPKLPLQLGTDGGFLREGAPVPAGSGVLMEAPSPLNPGRMALIVSGDSGDALVKAATAVSSTTPARLLAGSSAIIGDVALAANPSPSQDASSSSEPGSGPQLTLEQLGQSDQTVSGVGDHKITFKVELPGVPQPGQSLAANLVISHSPLLDGPNSSVRLIVNGTPLTAASMKQLDPSHGVVHVNLPPSAIRAGVNTFDVTFTMRLATVTTGACAFPPIEQAWAVLHKSSSIQVPDQLVAPSKIDLSDYPFPFVSTGGFRQTAFVVPAHFDVAPFIRFMSDLGRSLRADTPPPAVFTAGDPHATQTDANVILWGTPAENPLLAQIRDYLPLTVSPDEPRQFVFAGNLKVSVQDTANLGVVQEIASPWTPVRRLLVVSGTSPDTVSLAVLALEQPSLSNNLALASLAPAATPTPGATSPSVSVTTYQIGARLQAVQAHRGISLMPIILTVGLALLALGMAFFMAYRAFVVEPRSKR